MNDEVDLAAGFAGTLDVHIPMGTGRGHTDLTLTAGQVDWQAEEYFGRYHCHWLSSALSGLTGWQHTTFEVREPDGTWKPVHSGVLAPTGRVLDIFGERESDQVQRFYSQAHQGREVRQRHIAPAEMPGEVITDNSAQRGDRHWWARSLPQQGRAAYLHFAREVLARTGYHRHPDAPAPARPAPATHDRMGEPDTSRPEAVTVSGFGATCRRGLTEARLRPDEVTDNARELFGHRQCVLLAVELHRQTGWPLAVVDRRMPGEDWEWSHVAVRHPSGDLVDIDGQRSDQQLINDRTADGYQAPKRVRDLGGEDALRKALNIGPDMTGPAWHTSLQGFSATYRHIVARLATAVAKDTTTPTNQQAHTSTHRIAPEAAPSPASTSTTGGSSAMSSIDEIRHALSMSSDKTDQAINALQQVINEVEEIRGVLEHAMQGSNQPDIQQGIGMYSRALNDLGDLQNLLRGGNDAVTSYAGRL